MKYAQLGNLFKDQHEVLTVREVANTIRCSESHILRMVYNEELACFMIGAQYRVLKKDVIDCFRITSEKKTANRRLNKLENGRRLEL